MLLRVVVQIMAFPPGAQSLLGALTIANFGFQANSIRERMDSPHEAVRFTPAQIRRVGGMKILPEAPDNSGEQGMEQKSLQTDSLIL
tara:strand:- start:1566 stop:1826 length:261 start_codon:yes stop_codon:yes gene_type:complete